MRILAIALRSHTGALVETWEQFLHLAMRVINNRMHRVLRMSPYKALMGFDQRTPVIASLDGASLSGFPAEADDYAPALDDYQRVLSASFYQARTRTIYEQTARAAKHAAAVKKPVSFSKGDFVLYREYSTPHKLLSPENAVAYEILAVLPHNVYEIKSIISFNSRKAHGENLRYIKQTRAEAESALTFAIESGTAILKSILRHSQDSVTKEFTFEVEWLDSSTSWEPATNLRKVTIFKEYVALAAMARAAPSTRLASRSCTPTW